MEGRGPRCRCRCRWSTTVSASVALSASRDWKFLFGCGLERRVAPLVERASASPRSGKIFGFYNPRYRFPDTEFSGIRARSPPQNTDFVPGTSDFWRVGTIYGERGAQRLSASPKKILSFWRPQEAWLAGICPEYPTITQPRGSHPGHWAGDGNQPRAYLSERRKIGFFAGAMAENY